MLAREVRLLREQVRAAQLSAAESERLAAELLRRVAALEARAQGTRSDVAERRG